MFDKKENLRELIEKYMDEKKSQMYLEDIDLGEQILMKYPAPEPDDMLLANIKANIALKALPQKTVTFKRRVYEALVVAASIAIIAVISLHSINDTINHVDDININIATLIPESLINRQDNTFSEMDEHIKQLYNHLEVIEVTKEDYQDTIVFEELSNQLEYLKNRIGNLETTENMNYRNYDDLDSLDIIEGIKNRLEEI